MDKGVTVIVQARKQSASEKKARLQQALREGQRIVIDLDFADKMTPTEIKSLCQQLLYCYSANTRAQNPAQLIFTSLQVWRDIAYHATFESRHLDLEMFDVCITRWRLRQAAHRVPCQSNSANKPLVWTTGW